MLTDLYQITMAYAYWKDKRADAPSTFDLFFRTNPFKGEFTIFAGLEEVLKFMSTFKFSPSDVAYLRTVMPTVDEAFWPWLGALDCSAVRLYAVAEGTVVFPREPLLRVEGPLAVVQLLETTLLNLCNFASLVTTNAARMRLAAGKDATVLEFGLRRAQGPDGAMSASRYSFMGGCDATSNVAAGKEFGVPLRGTHAHSMVCSYTSLEDLSSRMLGDKDIVALALKYREELGFHIASKGEMAAFIAFAQAFPKNLLCLVDTYDTLNSGVPNYICVALALLDCGFEPKGIRLDSGDLAYLSKEARKMMMCGGGRGARGRARARAPHTPRAHNILTHPRPAPPPPPPPALRSAADAKYGSKLAAGNIVVSNDLNEAVLLSLADQGHEINTFAIGTNLVTCQAQPALGMVFKLVDINGEPRIKLSQDAVKTTIPGAKEVYRLLGQEGVPLMDLMIRAGEPRPQPGKRLLARHPFDEKKRAYVTPTVVLPLLRLVFCGRATAAVLPEHPTAFAASEGASASVRAAAAAGSAPAAEAAAGGGGGGGGGGAAAGAAVGARASAPSLGQLKAFVKAQMGLFREDHLRLLNPTPYKVSLSTELFHFLHELLLKEVPIPEME